MHCTQVEPVTGQGELVGGIAIDQQLVARLDAAPAQRAARSGGGVAGQGVVNVVAPGQIDDLTRCLLYTSDAADDPTRVSPGVYVQSITNIEYINTTTT